VRRLKAGANASQADLSEWRRSCAIRSEQMARDGLLPGGHRKFWYLAKCLYDGGLDCATVEEHLKREKDIAHNPTEREAEISAILEGFFG